MIFRAGRTYTRGDQLLQIDRKLEDNLDYVLPARGDLPAGVSPAFVGFFFATRVGRFLTRFLILPFGGASWCWSFLITAWAAAAQIRASARV